MSVLAGNRHRGGPGRRPAGGHGIAVVELFTSEGCSSCPPADVVLADLQRRSSAVYALEFHVDYWDGLGWPDRFSSPDWTGRQQQYAEALGARGLYTPQMIVGGTDAFNGSDRARALRDVARSLSEAAPVHLSVRSRAVDSERVAIEVEAPGAPAGATVDIAIVQHQATTNVRGGENAGRTLRHANVVRAFEVARLPASTLTIRLPMPLHGSDGEVVAFVQRSSRDAPGMPILGAARAPLP